jgi:hypothetical protein
MKMVRQNLLIYVSFLVVLSLLFSFGIPQNIPSVAKEKPDIDVHIRNPFTDQWDNIVLNVSVSETIQEDEWIVVFFPSIFPIPKYSQRQTETGEVITTQDTVLQRISVNFLHLSPFKELPILNYAENSIAFQMPETLEVNEKKDSKLMIRFYLESGKEEGKGCFGVWHKSFSSIKYSSEIEIMKEPKKLSDFSVIISQPRSNEATDWDITFTHNNPWTIYQNQATLVLSFQKKMKIPSCPVDSRITVNDTPVYQAKAYDKGISIILPISICPDDKIHIQIPASYEFGFGSEIGSYEYTAWMEVDTMRRYSHQKYYGVFDVLPGNPYVSASSNTVGVKTKYTLYWYLNPKDSDIPETIDIQWPSEYPLENGTGIYYSWKSYGLPDKAILKDGILNIPLPKDPGKNGLYSLYFTQYFIERKSYDFINPSVDSLVFNYRVDADGEWISFLPLYLKPKGFHFVNAYTSPAEAGESFRFDCKLHAEELYTFLTEGLVVHLPSCIQLPINISENGIYILGLGASSVVPQVQVLQNSLHLLVSPDDLNPRYKDIEELTLTIHERAGLLFPTTPGNTVRIGVETSATGYIDWTQDWVVLPSQPYSTVRLNGGELGDNDWYIQPPVLHFNTPTIGYATVNSTFISLPAEDIPLLCGQYNQYFYVSDEVHSFSTVYQNNFQLKVDTKTICCEIFQPDKDWRIVSTSPYIVKGKVQIPITIERNEFKKIIDQSIQIQGNAGIIMPSGEFQAEIPLQKGKNELTIFIRDWAGHTNTILRNVYYGNGVEVQIGSSVGYINGRKVTLSTHPVIKSGRVFVPLRFLAEAFDAVVHYDDEAKPPRIEVRKAKDTIELFLGHKTATVNGNPITLDDAPFIQDDSAMIPMYFLVDIWNMEAIWEAVERRITILFPL